MDIEEEEKLRSKGTPEQKRGATNVDQDKCRICLEARQVVLSYFDHNQDPVGLVIPSILTIQGAYARISNISADHKWIKDEQFYIGNKLVEHKAGQHTSCLHEYVELRKIYP